MEINVPRIHIVGCGPGSKDYVSPAAREAVRSADVLLGSRRLLDLFPEFTGPAVPWQGGTQDMLNELARVTDGGQAAAVLVSGDPGLFSLARNVLERFGASACRIVPGVSSVQVAFARLGLAGANAKILSAHGRSPDVRAGELAGHDTVAILAGTPEAMAFCARAAGDLRPSHAAFICENLTLADERIRRLEPEAVASCSASSLTVVVLVRKELIL